MSPKKCLPLSVKLKLLADQERGFSPKFIQKKYKVKKSTYYRILSEKDTIKSVPIKTEIKQEPENDDDVDPFATVEEKDKIQESHLDENCDNQSSLDGVNHAVMHWYNEQKAEGVPVESADIDEAAERLAQKLGFTHFKVNSSSGWPLRFRKSQDGLQTSLENLKEEPVEPDEEEEDEEEEEEGDEDNALRIQDQITAFQRLQAGESAEQIAEDLGVSKTTILSVKKKLKDTLFNPSLDPNYQISVERLNTTRKHDNESKLKFTHSEELSDIDTMPDTTHDSDGDSESVWATIQRRKQLKSFKNGISNRDRSLTRSEILEAIAQFKAGFTIKQIARHFSVSPSTIFRAKKKFSTTKIVQARTFLKLEEKVTIIERLEEGDTMAEISAELGVPQSTVKSIKKRKGKIMNVYKASLRTVSKDSSTQKKPTVNDKMEKRLLDWINDLKRRKMQMTNAMILKKALMIQMNVSQEEGGSSKRFIPSKNWLDNFKKRHNIRSLLNEESKSGSESEDLTYWKAAPKSKKKLMISRQNKDSGFSSVSEPQTGGMALSKLAEGLREMYLTMHLPSDPYRCNAFTPRVIVSQLEQNLITQHTTSDTPYYEKNEPPSEEETWLTGHTNACSDSDWGEEDWDTHSTEVYRSKDNSKRKRKETSSEYNSKRRRLSGGYSSDNKSDVDHNRSNFANVRIKQEPPSSLDSVHSGVPNSVHSGVPMAVLPAGSTYVPPLPMFQMPTTGLTVFMPESQQMMMQHSVSYPHDNSSDLFMNQQHIRSRTEANSPPIQLNDVHSEANVEPNIAQGNENVIVMPFGREICEQEESRQLLSPHPDSACDSSAGKARKDRAALIAESISISLEGSSNKQLRELTFKLLELNNKNLICDERIDKAREEFEKTVAQIESEKKMNDTEIDKVLVDIQEWKKEAKSQSNT